MLAREEQLRLSPATQAEYDAHALPPHDIEDRIQRQVLAEHGFEGSSDANLLLYRLTNTRFPSDAALRQLVVYLREDHMRAGDLRVGDAAPDATLAEVAAAREVSLLSLEPKDGRVLVVAAGSGS
mmetsp:Transcript_1247/g.4636  ORF Transcript_1247/g.4636 Transcript_1247/m.4636 type:complete len:125 (-) Transcript_1247:1233-1607(-)